MDHVLVDSFERLLADLSTPPVVRSIESGEPWQPLWQQLVDSGFVDALVNEESGGAGLSLQDALALWFECGRHALPLPLAQTMIARGVLAHSGVDIPDGLIVIAPVPVHPGPGKTADAQQHAVDCRNVPFGRVADWVVVSHSHHSDDTADMLLPAQRAVRSDVAVHGSQQAHLSWKTTADSAKLKQRYPWQELAALSTAAQMAGAMDRIMNITVNYAGERIQFGRPIGKFQAVQQQLSVLAELAAASRMAAELGGREESPLMPNPLAAAVAKARASEAAENVVKIAHAVHAAMGITAEYDLQLYTRRLIEWRTDYGSAGYWNRRVGDAVLSSDIPSTLEFMLPAFFPETTTG